MNAAPITACLISGSLAPECDNVVRYDWREFALVVERSKGHEQGKETRAVLESMTREAACAEAAETKRVIGHMISKLKLELVNRTCTIETTFEQDLSEDGDGSMMRVERVIAGSKWGYERYRRTLWIEADDALKALAR